MPDKLPSMPVFVADLLGSTRASLLSLEERGAYDWLMFHEWNEPDGLPYDLDALCRLLGATVDERKSVEKVMGQFFKNQDGKLWNEKLERVREDIHSLTRARSEAARRRWNKPGRCKADAKGYAKPNANTHAKRMHPIPNPNPNPSPKEDEESLLDGGMSTDDPLTFARIDWGAHFQTWNTLAAEHGLRAVKALKADRRKKLQARLREHGPKFWELVASQLAVRSRWARDKAMPTFDQLMTPSICQRLLEGCYSENDKGTGRPDWV